MTNNSMCDILDKILSYDRETQKRINDSVKRNNELTKTIATVRSILERTLKSPDNRNAAIYECINLCRANFIYLDYSSGKTKIDPPLKNDEKVLP